MMLPFKLLSQPTADTTAQTQKDTRTLASGEALQRLKDTGAMNLQRQKGMDARQNTLLGMGINPTQQGLRSGTFSPEVANQLSNFFNTKRMLEQLQGYDAGASAGIRIDHKNPFTPGGAIQQMRAGFPLKGEAQEIAKGKFVQEAGTKTKGQRHRQTGEYLSPFESVEETTKAKTEGKSGSPSASKKAVEKALDIQAMLAKIPPEGVPYVRPNGQVGRLYNRNGKPVFKADQ